VIVFPTWLLFGATARIEIASVSTPVEAAFVLACPRRPIRACTVDELP
jgi:hypothetical protein